MTLVPWWCLFLYVIGCHSHIYKHGGSWNGYEFHTYPHPAKKPGVPRDTMVDVINNLGLKLLAIHNEYNENNIAISPYGALSVLIALGEGLEGDAVYEIQQAANIPHDISIIRIGLRDVHRHLKSYFIPKEGFLAGLTLNHENVTLRLEYEDILKFYGYDTISFNNALYPEPSTTEIPQSTYGQITTTDDIPTILTTEIGKKETDEQSATEKVARATTEFATTAKFTPTTDAEETTTMLVPETRTDKITTTQTTLTIPTTEETSTTTTLPEISTDVVTVEPKTLEITSTNAPTITELTTLETEVSSTEKPTTTAKPTTTEEEEVTTTIVSTTTQLSTTEKVSEETTTQSTRSTRSIPTTTILSTTEPTTTAATTSINVAESDSTTESTTMRNLLTTSQDIITTISLSSDTVVDTTSTLFTTLTVPLTSTGSNNEDTSTMTTTEPMQENVDVTTSFITTLLTTTGEESTSENTAISENESTTMPTINEESTENINKDNEIDNDVSTDGPGFGGTFKRNARTGQSNVVELNMRETSIGNTDQKHNSKRRGRSVLDYIIARYYDEHYTPHHSHRPYVPKEQLSFLVYEKYREYNINFMKYDTVLPFHYVAHLNALALSFPLDSTKYYLLLLLPVDETGIDKLICDLRLNGSLRQIISNLKYAHVVATIPSFMLKGYVTLTPSFQKLGIRKVFEPRQADFSPMTNQQGIYVTNIEQAITVTIRNYVDPNSIEHFRNLRQYDPVHFKADHPFLYFVIDSEIHVTLMAGKIVNPLNSRIS